jgi:hypothetical protein
MGRRKDIGTIWGEIGKNNLNVCSARTPNMGVKVNYIIQ